MFVQDNLEINSIAIAKRFGQEKVNVNHLLLAICDFLIKHEPQKCTETLKASSERAHAEESRNQADGFRTPSIPTYILQMIKGCETIDDLVSLGDECIANSIHSSSNVGTKKHPEVNSVGDFHVPVGPNFGSLPRIIPNKEYAAQLIQSFLQDGEIYAWDGPYNTKDPVLATRHGQSMGRLFVTNKRILFWSDDLPKPHIGLFYGDIQGWKTSWMPLKSRGVIAMVGGRKVIFAANSTAIENADRFIQKRG